MRPEVCRGKLGTQRIVEGERGLLPLHIITTRVAYAVNDLLESVEGEGF